MSPECLIAAKDCYSESIQVPRKAGGTGRSSGKKGSYLQCSVSDGVDGFFSFAEWHSNLTQHK